MDGAEEGVADVRAPRDGLEAFRLVLVALVGTVPFRVVEGGEKGRRGLRARVHKDLVGRVAELQAAEVALRENRASGEVALGRVRQVRFVVGVVSHVAKCASGQQHTRA